MGYDNWMQAQQIMTNPQQQRNTNVLTTTAPNFAAKKQYEDALKIYEPGGSYSAGVTTQLERERAKYLSSAMQGLVGSGLSNTTMPAGLAGKFSEEVAAPTLANVESQRVQTLANIKAAYAQMLQGAQENGLSRAMQLNGGGTTISSVVDNSADLSKQNFEQDRQLQLDKINANNWSDWTTNSANNSTNKSLYSTIQNSKQEAINYLFGG